MHVLSVANTVDNTQATLLLYSSKLVKNGSNHHYHFYNKCPSTFHTISLCVLVPFIADPELPQVIQLLALKTLKASHNFGKATGPISSENNVENAFSQQAHEQCSADELSSLSFLISIHESISNHFVKTEGIRCKNLQTINQF
jgi:hypothetical protein